MEPENSIVQLRQMLASNFIRQTYPQSNSSPKASFDISRFMTSNQSSAVRTSSNKFEHAEDFKGEGTLSSTMKDNELLVNEVHELKEVDEEGLSNYNTKEYIKDTFTDV
jgi:hypothetical protein